jgi:hypothetical protein
MSTRSKRTSVGSIVVAMGPESPAPLSSPIATLTRRKSAVGALCPDAMAALDAANLPDRYVEGRRSPNVFVAAPAEPELAA